MYQYNPLLLTEDKTEENIYGGVTGAVAGSVAPTVAALPLLTKFKRGYDFGGMFGDDKLPEPIAKLKVNGKQSVADYMKEKGLHFKTGSHPMGPHFNPATDTIQLPIKDKYMDKYGKSVFAHELGHSAKMQAKKGVIPKKVYAYGVSKQLTSVTALAQIINCFRSDDESRQQVGRALSVAGGVSSIPMIAEEIGASMRGTKMLGLKGADKARAFIGVGSYITLALSPAIIYQVSERTRKFLRKLKEVKDENPEVSQNLEMLKQQDAKVKI